MNCTLSKYLIFWLTLFLSWSSLAQTSPELLPKVEFFSIPNSPINAEEISDIKIDNEGQVWIVSFKGLYRYDGEKFQKISANYNSFGSLIRFYQGTGGERFVIDYWGGIYFVDNDSLFEYSNNETIRSLYKSYGYSDIFLEGDKLHFAFHASSYKTIENGKLRDPLSDKGINFSGFACRLMPNREPFMFRGFGSRSNGKGEHLFYLFDHEFNVLDSIRITIEKRFNPSSVVKLPNGNHLFSSGKGNLIEFSDRKIIREIKYPDQVINLFVDDNANLWISTRGKGIHLYENGVIDTTKKQTFLSNTTSIASTQDYQGGIWLYSQERGIGYISHPEIKFYNQDKRVKPLVEALISIDDKVFYADENKLMSIKIEEEIKVKEVIDVGEQIMRFSYDKLKKRLWISTRNNLYYYEDNRLNRVDDTGKKLNASFSYFDSEWEDENISLIGTNNYRYFKCKDTSLSFISKKYEYKLKGVLLKNDTVFLNTGNGIYVETRDSTIYLGDEYEKAKKFANQLVLFNQKVVLTLPSEGIYVYDGKSLEPIMYNGEVIPNAKLVKESEMVMWGISNYGCFRIEAKEGKFLTEAYSPLPRMVIKTAIIKDGKLIMQTRNSGIGIIDLKELQEQKLYSPRVLITRAQTKNKLYYKTFDIAPIPYDENSVQLSFKSLNYHDLDVLYRFRLEGKDDDWITTTTGFVNYVSLSPDQYKFIVQSRFGLGDWSNSKTIQFEVIPPFWRTWWFIITASLLLLIIAYQMVTYRFRIIDKEKSLMIGRLTAEQKSLRAKMDPHFMFNIIASVQYLIIKKENKKATVFLNQFSSLLRNTLDQSDSEFVTVNDEIRFLREYIELEKMRLEDRFDYTIEIDDKVNKEHKIPTFLIQPFVENAIHHGLKSRIEKGFLSLSFVNDKQFLKVKVEDNGVGYQASMNTKREGDRHVSHGIQTIKDRLKIYNGKQSVEAITIIDKKESGLNETGTIVTVCIKNK